MLLTSKEGVFDVGVIVPASNLHKTWTSGCFQPDISGTPVVAIVFHGRGSLLNH